MDLVPKPGQVVAAAGNVAHLLLGRGLADLRPMPRTPLDAGDLGTVHHYLPSDVVAPLGDPVLLVSPLAAPSSCYDLRRGCSLVEHLVDRGRPTYVLEHGEVSFHDRDLGLERWAQDAVPAAVRSVARHAGDRPVHVVGWSLGGTFALLAAAGADLPIASLSVLGSPVDVSQVPMVAPPRSLVTAADLPDPVARAYRVLAGVPAPLLHWAVELAPFQRLVTKPFAVATHLDDADWLAQVEAVDAFATAMTAYPGRRFGQLYHRFAKGNALATGTIEIGGEQVSLASVTAPTLVVAGAADGIAPVGAVRAALPLLTGAEDVRLEIVPGGHLGMLAGRGARSSTWPVLDGWFVQWDDRAVQGAAKKATKKTASRRPAKQPSRTPPAQPDAIGTNPRRRYSSAGSRTLSR